jgi:hypothetical protein
VSGPAGPNRFGEQSPHIKQDGEGYTAEEEQPPEREAVEGSTDANNDLPATVHLPQL